jgi:hypothetical protein
MQAHRWITLVLVSCALLAEAATFTGRLDRDTLQPGESAVLSLRCEGGLPKTTQPERGVSGLALSFIGEEKSIALVNGNVSASVTFRYRVIPDKLGDFTVPPFTVVLENETLRSEPLKLRVLAGLPPEKSPATVPEIDANGPPPAFLKLSAPTNAVYVGEAFPVEIQLFFQTAQNVQIPQPRVEGVRFLLLRPGSQQSRAQIGNSLYNVVTFRNAAVATKPGRLDLAFETDLTVVMNQGIIFGELKPVRLTSPVQTIRVLPLPQENVPASFSGAVGSFEMNIAAAPTNLPAGDPIMVKISLFGRGALDNVGLPGQDAWRDFKLYPPNTKLDHSDSIAMNNIKTFEQVVTANHAQVKALPALEFSFFDPESKSYRTVQSAPIPLRLLPSPAPVAAILTPAPASIAPAIEIKKPEIAHIKPRMGTLALVAPPFSSSPYFLALQLLPLLAFFGAVAWRKQKESLSKDPRHARCRAVDRLVADGLRELREHAKNNAAGPFHSTLSRLLAEQIGERLDLPASGIHESVLEERLRGRLDEPTWAALRELMQAANRACYAPDGGGRDLRTDLVRAEAVLKSLRLLAVGS